MPRQPVALKRTGGNVGGLKGLEQRIRKIRESEVYVGIPADKTQRNSEEINNASLLFIHTNGSPLHNIPARPVLEPAIQHDKQIIAQPLSEAAKAVLNNDPVSATTFLQRAGTVASNAAKRWFTNPANHWPPNAPMTIRLKGSSRPLIDTGQLRRAITWVIGKRK